MAQPTSLLSLELPGPRKATRVCVILPAYNTAKSIGLLVRQVRQFGVDPIVIDDGSKDRTVAAAAEAGALVVSHLGNQGKGRALRTGFRYALQVGYELIVTMDADGQHDPQDLPRFLDAPASAAVVIGHRLLEPAGMPRSRYLTNRLMSWIVSRVTGQTVPDSQCGFRMIRRHALQGLHLRSGHFDIETEMLLAAARQGWRIESVPIRTIYDGHASHIHPLLDGWRFLWLVALYLGRPRTPGAVPQPVEEPTP